MGRGPLGFTESSAAPSRAVAGSVLATCFLVGVDGRRTGSLGLDSGRALVEIRRGDGLSGEESGTLQMSASPGLSRGLSAGSAGSTVGTTGSSRSSSCESSSKLSSSESGTSPNSLQFVMASYFHIRKVIASPLSSFVAIFSDLSPMSNGLRCETLRDA